VKAFLLSLLFLPGAALAAPDEEILGKSRGYPVCPIQRGMRVEQHCLVGNYSHFDQVLPARKVARAAAPRPLKRAAAEPQVRYSGYGSSGGIDDFLAKNRNTGLLVMRGDTILVERYQYERRPEHRLTSMSMAKTVTAMLIGIALQESRIGSIDDLASQYAPDLKGHPYGETSIRHLLTMSSGVRFSEVYDGKDDVTRLSRALFLERASGARALEPFHEREHPAGKRFYYSSAETYVLGLVLRAAVGKPLSDYLSEKIWQPMGAEADATWIVDAAGQELAYIGLNATLRDWGRFGLLLAEEGAREGRQIIPAAWVRAATDPNQHAHKPQGRRIGYGYQTWTLAGRDGAFAALGLRGQAVMVDPATKTVVVHTAVHWGPGDPSRSDQFALFYAVASQLEKQQ
jgi:CubicO group peptidase (beta-lactamase class C family)